MLGESQRNEENVPHFFRSMLTAMASTDIDTNLVSTQYIILEHGSMKERTVVIITRKHMNLFDVTTPNFLGYNLSL